MGKYNTDIPDNMLSVINNCTTGLGIAGIGGGLIGAGTDLIVIAPVWVGMTVNLAEKAGHHMTEQTAKKIALAVCTGAGTFIAGTKIASSVLGWIGAAFTFGASLALSAAANAALNASFTKAYGKAAARFFLKTTQISNIEVMVSVIIALMGADLGFSTPYDYLIA